MLSNLTKEEPKEQPCNGATLNYSARLHLKEIHPISIFVQNQL